MARTVELVIQRLQALGCEPRRSGRGWQARCPSHRDTRPSLAVAEGRDGRALLKCHAGCSIEQIVSALSLEMRDLMPPGTNGGRRPRAFGTIEAAVRAIRKTPPDYTWVYTNDKGEPIGAIVRWGDKAGKTIRPLRWTPDGWAIGAPPEPRPLLYLPDLLSRPNETVWVTEGELACDALRSCGLLATTSLGGSKATHKTDWTVLSGRNVMLLPDNDLAGAEYIRDVGRELARLDPQPTVKVLRLAEHFELPKGGDIADLLGLGGQLECHEDPAALLEELASKVEPIDLDSVGETEVNDASEEPLRVRAVTRRLSEVEPQRLRWLWPQRIPLGKLTLLAGDPGLGKSLLTLDVAARVSRGTSWPDLRDEPTEAGGVVLLTAEDDLADTVRPRLEAARADLSRIVALEAVEVPDVETRERRRRRFDLGANLRQLEETIDTVEGCRLVIVDPLSAFMPSDRRFDSHRNSDVRGILAPLADLAQRRGVAVLAVTHLRKGEGPAMYRAMGSLAFVAAARAVWAVTRDKDDPKGPRRLVLPVKANLSPNPTGLAYSVTSAELGPVVAWEPEPVAADPDEYLAPPRVERAGERGQKFLEEALAFGPRPASELIEEAEQYGISERSLRRALKKIGGHARKDSFGTGWIWSLGRGEAAIHEADNPQGDKLSPSAGASARADFGGSAPEADKLASSGLAASDMTASGNGDGLPDEDELDRMLAQWGMI